MTYFTVGCNRLVALMCWQKRGMNKIMEKREKGTFLQYERAPDSFSLEAVCKWAGECMCICERLKSCTYYISHSPQHPHLHSQTASVSSHCLILCQGCSHGGLPWCPDTRKRNSVVTTEQWRSIRRARQLGPDQFNVNTEELEQRGRTFLLINVHFNILKGSY